jgi:hypothetical protein
VCVCVCVCEREREREREKRDRSLFLAPMSKERKEGFVAQLLLKSGA